MSIYKSYDGETLVLGMGPSLVAQNRNELKQTVLDELHAGTRRFRVDFARTFYIDSSGLGVLVSLTKTIHARAGDLSLVRLNEDLRALVRMTKLDTILHVDDSFEGGDDETSESSPLA